VDVLAHHLVCPGARAMFVVFVVTWLVGLAKGDHPPDCGQCFVFSLVENTITNLEATGRESVKDRP